MSSISRGRWARGMMSVVGVEHRSPALASAILPAQFQVADNKAWRLSTDLSGLPDAVRPAREARPKRLHAPVAADLVAIAKFDVDARVKLRSFYPTAGLSARLQVGRAHARDGVSRTLEAYRQVSQYAPDLMPRIDDHGSARFAPGVYLVEELVSGSHPTTRNEVQKLAEPLASELLRLYKGVGVTSRPLSAVVHRRMMERWEAFASEAGVDPAVRAAVQRVVWRDALLEVSLGHGDLVRSNIVVSDERIVLIDWEYAGERPIAFDLAKIHLDGLEPDATQEGLERGLDYAVGQQTGHYSFGEQLALAHVQMLSWHRARYAKAAKAGRGRVLAAQNRQRLRGIARLLDVDTPAS